MAAAPAPSFGARMSFAAALANPASNSTGLYRIYKDGRPVYAGRAAPGTIRSRLINHRWCLTHMGVEDSNYTVSFAPMTGSSTAQVVAAEKTEIRRMRRNRVHRGTNVREGELEWMLGRESMSSDPDDLGGFLTKGLRRRPAPGGPSTVRSPQAPPPPSTPPPSSGDGPPIPLVRRKPRPPRGADDPPSTRRSRLR